MERARLGHGKAQGGHGRDHDRRPAGPRPQGSTTTQDRVLFSHEISPMTTAGGTIPPSADAAATPPPRKSPRDRGRPPASDALPGFLHSRPPQKKTPPRLSGHGEAYLWLPDQDSNLDWEIQSLLSYH